MIGCFKTVSFAWVNKIAVIGFTWLFVYQKARSHEGRMNAGPGAQYLNDTPAAKNPAGI